MPEPLPPDVVETSREVVRAPHDLTRPATSAPAVRGPRDLVDYPPHDVAGADRLLRSLGRVQTAVEPVLASIEEGTGLRRGPIFVLRAVGAGHRHPRAIGREVGIDTAGAQSLVDQLMHDGHLQPAPPRPGDRHVELTTSGRSVLEHAEAVVLRSADAFLQVLGPRRSGEVVRALDVLARALTEPEPVPRSTPSGGPVALPGAPLALPSAAPGG